jgi:hypothetical protein
MTGVAWPERRADVVAALDTLASFARRRAAEPRPWPDLGDAVQWLVDETWWDERDPAQDIGLLLRDTDEATAIGAVLAPLLAMLDALGPTAPDSDYLAHPRWRETATAAARARRLLARD